MQDIYLNDKVNSKYVFVCLYGSYVRMHRMIQAMEHIRMKFGDFVSIKKTHRSFEGISTKESFTRHTCNNIEIETTCKITAYKTVQRRVRRTSTQLCPVFHFCSRQCFRSMDNCCIYIIFHFDSVMCLSLSIFL
jgi:hypothetical protein